MTTSHSILFILRLLRATDLDNLMGATTLKNVLSVDSFFEFSVARK
jgi:hypothetical protein